MSYDAVSAIDNQIEKLKNRRDALLDGMCYIPLPSYESMIDPYGLGSYGIIDTSTVENKEGGFRDDQERD